ncbi:MAG: chromate transporter [Clostridia bacterium]|nr:chromate transporter [Clostridia bacterium]NCC75366.1 chromate transporter [Clostridia bacterium]
MILWQLFFTFFRIGLFTFGGGYAMVPLIQREMTSQQWLSAQQFGDILAISQITPGPLAINTATYVGFVIAGVAGSAAATMGVMLPSFLLILILTHWLDRIWHHPLTRMAFHGLRPTVVALLASATWFFTQASLIRPLVAGWTLQLKIDPLSLVSPISIVLFALTLLLQVRFRLSPIPVILICGVVTALVLPIWPGWA